MTSYIPQLPVSQVFMPVQAPAVAKRPNPTNSSHSVNVKKAKVSQEKALSVKGRPGPVATIFMKAKPVPTISATEPQPEDIHNAEILPSGWSDDDEGSAPNNDIKPEDGVVVNPNSLIQLLYPKKKKG